MILMICLCFQMMAFESWKDDDDDDDDIVEISDAGTISTGRSIQHSYLSFL